MQTLIRDMLIWLATFFSVSLLLVFAVRWGLSRIRQRRKERLKDIELRCRQAPEELGIPLAWRTSPAVCEGLDFRWGQTLLWPLPLGIAAAGVMWSATGQQPLNWNGAGLGVAAACLLFALLYAWLTGRRETALPRQIRQLALALRCWAIRLEAGIECRQALDQTARQLRRIDPELARTLEAAANEAGDQPSRAFSYCGTGLGVRLSDILAGKTGTVTNTTNVATGTTAPLELRSIANQLDGYYLNLLLSRTRLIENWMRYPLALCLVPALNLILFSPAITDLIDKFGKLSVPGAQQVQPLEPIPQAPEEIPQTPAE